MNRNPTRRRAILLAVALLPPLAGATPPRGPAQDVVAVLASTPLDDIDALPALDRGREILARVDEALSLIRARVPQAARPLLTETRQELDALRRNPAEALPDTYRVGGEWWLPVRADRLQVALDAPDLLPRSRPDTDGGRVANLPARAQRTVWLPLARAERRIAEALSQLAAGESGRLRARRQLEAVINEVLTRVTFTDADLIAAYYRIEAALSAAPHWNAGVHDQLRAAAESLNAVPGQAGLAARTQALADRQSLDWRPLQALALDLRKALIAAASGGPTDAASGVPTRPGEPPGGAATHADVPSIDTAPSPAQPSGTGA